VRALLHRWYLERRIYVAVRINISVASLLFLTWSAWFSLFTLFVGGANGVVRGNRLLHHGELPVLARRRTPAQSGAHAVSPVRSQRHGRGVHQQSPGDARRSEGIFVLIAVRGTGSIRYRRFP
jgi:hypothetical protein